MDIYRDAKRRGIYPPLFTDPQGDSCFSINQIRCYTVKVYCFPFTVYCCFQSPTTRQGSNLDNDKHLTKQGHSQSSICVMECLLLTHILQFHVNRSKFLSQDRKKQVRLILNQISKNDRPGL